MTKYNATQNNMTCHKQLLVPLNPYYDLHLTSLVTFQFECLDLCKAASTCAWFTFFPHSKVCELLATCEHLEDKICQDCISGQRGCQKPICWVTGIKEYCRFRFNLIYNGDPKAHYREWETFKTVLFEDRFSNGGTFLIVCALCKYAPLMW